MRVVVILVGLLLSAAASQAQARNPLYGEPSDFLGTWNNIEVQRNLVVRIEIRPYERGQVIVTVYGLHNGEPCRFGDYRGRFYLAKYPREREQDNSAVLVKVEQEWVHGHVLLRFNGRGEIVSHALLNFRERGDVYSVERFAAAYHGEEGPYRGEGEEGYPHYRQPSYRGY